MLNVAGMTACPPVPKMAVHAASKAFVPSFTEALRYETRGTGVTVLAFSPGPARTGFHRAFRVLDGSRRPPSAVPGTANRVAAGVTRLLPRRVGPALMACGVQPAEPAPAGGGPGPAA